MVAEVVPAQLAEPEDPVFTLHRAGKIEMRSTVALRGPEDLALAYTPGVAQASVAIQDEPERVHELTWRPNTVAVVTDGSAVLGLGDVGPDAALPVMEGKALLFKNFAAIDAVPLCLDCRDVDDLVDTIARLAPSFGGINLEDISAPRCFELESKLQQRLSIPVLHDDQHGTAVVVAAALMNALRLTGREAENVRVVVSGAGAAGVAVTKMLRTVGIGDVVVLDREGVIHRKRGRLSPIKRELAEITNNDRLQGGPEDALRGADVLIGVSGGAIPTDAVEAMARDAIVFALANPDPEVHPDVAKHTAAVVATGRSDFPNQINNVLAFPGIFRGALDVRADQVSDDMKLAASKALADLVGDDLRADYVIPGAFDDRVAATVADAVAEAAVAGGIARAEMPE